jgi:formylglycine-generating enzyme required for sulfatase activity
MAGNVAEWTASPTPDNPDSYLIKGGSFQDSASGVQVSTATSAPQEYAAPWLGFRCAVDLPS